MLMRIRQLSSLGTLCLVLPLAVTGQVVPAPSASPTPAMTVAAVTPAIPAPTTATAIPDASPAAALPMSSPTAMPIAAPGDTPANELPATIEPPIGGAASDPNAGAAPAASPGTTADASSTLPATTTTSGDAGAARPREFQGDELGQVLRLLARQAKIDLVVGETIQGTVTMRLEHKTAMQAIEIIVQDKGLYMFDSNGTWFIKTMAEKAKEATDPASYTFSYARADQVLALLNSQLQSGIPAQVDARTNTVYYREAKSNKDAIAAFLLSADRPTRQVMIEARLVEVNANPRQSYGVNWSGVLGSSSSPQTFKYGGTSLATYKQVPLTRTAVTTAADGTISTATIPVVDSQGFPVTQTQVDTPAKIGYDASTGQFSPIDLFTNSSLNSLANQFAILSIPQMSLTMRFLNEDADAEFLANPRIVTADNQEATIKITRKQPVPQLNFNEQTATAVFGGFEDKEYGNTLIVRPAINKDDFVSLSVKPTISNKVADATFTFSGATVSSPVIDTRSIESNVLIKSGDTLAIGGLLQDEGNKGRTKVPVLGDIPGLGYLFQEKLNSRTKRNLLVFVTPTIIKQGYGTGLEDQVSGLTSSGEEFADPNGWRNNAKGSIRVIPTSNRALAADYAKPGQPAAPKKIKMLSTVTQRDDN